MASAKWHITSSGDVRKCSAKQGNCLYRFPEDHFLDRQEAIVEAEKRDSEAAAKETKRLSKLPSYVKEFFELASAPTLQKKQEKELESLRRFLDGHSILTIDAVRFGDDKVFEPDFVVRSEGKLVGIEITEIYGSREIAIAYNRGEEFFPATEEQWLTAIKERYEDKLSDRKDGQRYDRTKFSKIILLMDDKSGRDLRFVPRTDSNGRLRFLPNGTPVSDITLFQQLFQPWSDVIDESYLVGLSTTNKLGNILIKGHLNVKNG